MANPGDQIQLCCFLWARPGQEAALSEERDRVVARTEVFPVDLRGEL